MIAEDFVFDKREHNERYDDYWFDVVGASAKELTDEYMEQSMVGVTSVVYSVTDGVLGVRRQFPFNYDVITPNNPELKDIIKSIVEEMRS